MCRFLPKPELIFTCSRYQKGIFSGRDRVSTTLAVEMLEDDGRNDGGN